MTVNGSDVNDLKQLAKAQKNLTEDRDKAPAVFLQLQNGKDSYKFGITSLIEV